MRRKRPTTTLALPGDRDIVLAVLVREAVARDDALTPVEFIARAAGRKCAELSLRHAQWGIPWCRPGRPCEWCTWVQQLPYSKDN
jgi:hypothetical protein